MVAASAAERTGGHPEDEDVNQQNRSQANQPGHPQQEQPQRGPEKR